jgi:hypothetical protein
MTAEIAIMNKWGVALAADSAVTIETSASPKIYNTNKLFMLSKFEPVGVMVYGNAELMGLPWEAIIKKYRREELKNKCFKRLKEYGEHFISYLDKNVDLFPQEEQENNVYLTVYSYLFQLINKDIRKSVEKVTNTGKKVSGVEIRRIANKIVKAHFDSVIALPRLDTLPTTFEKDILRKYLKIFDQVIDDVFQKLPLSAVTRRQLRRICVALFVNDMSAYVTNSSGIVIAGFGEEELYPSLVSYEIECVVNDRVKYTRDRSAEITRQQSAALVPFAQHEMVVSFMAGISPAYRKILEGYLATVFDKYPEELIKELTHLTAKKKSDLLAKLKQAGSNEASAFWGKVNEWAQEHHIDKVLSAVSVLPKDELASMAESLVNLTSFKRRVTLDAETVGGPIDVAVISRGDGFVWIKRKHYFDATENPHFAANYYR